MESIQGHWYRSTVDTDASQSEAIQNATHTIAKLFLDDIVQIRTNVIVTASFNITVALGIVLNIIYDAWKLWKKNYGGMQDGGRFDFLKSIHPAEVLPLVLSAAIMMQGVIFIAVQSLGLSTVNLMNCRDISQIVWPAIWMVSEVLLVFGLEIAYRGVKRDRFAPRGPWNISICWSITAVLILLTWIPSKVHHSPFLSKQHPDRCIASLIWFAAPFWLFGIVFNSIIIFAFLATAALIAYQLYVTNKISREERISASRAVYYLVLGAILMTFVLPFWVEVPHFHLNEVTPTEIATITLNIFGFVNGAAHLILRSNSDKIAIRSSRAAWGSRREWRIFGSGDLNLAEHIERPITIGDGEGNELGRFGGDEKRPLPGLRSPNHQYIPPKSFEPSIPAAPSAVRASAGGHARKISNYSLFPSRNRASSYYPEDSDDLAPPRPLFARRHKRDSSMMSSATVQIGLRLSHAALAATGLGQTALTPEGSVHENSNTRPGPPNHSYSEHSINLPIQRNDSTPSPDQPPVPNPFDGSSATQFRSNVLVKRTPTRRSSPLPPAPSSGVQQRPPQRQRSPKDRLFDPLPPIPVSPDAGRNSAIPDNLKSPPARSLQIHQRAQMQLSSPRSPPAQAGTSFLPSSPRPIISPSTSQVQHAQRAFPRPVIIQKPQNTHPSPLRMAPTFPPSSPPPQLPPPPSIVKPRSPSPELQPDNWPLRNSFTLLGGPSQKTESVATGGSSGVILLPSTTYKAPEAARSPPSATSARRGAGDDNEGDEREGRKRGSIESEVEIGLERERRDWI